LTAYYAFSISFSLIAPIFTLGKVKFNTDFESIDDYNNVETQATFGVVIIMLFVLFAVKNLTGVRRITLRAKRTHDKEKNNILWCFNVTFGLYIGVYMFCWIFFAISNYYVLFLSRGITKKFTLTKESMDANLNSKDATALLWFVETHSLFMLFMGIVMSIMRAFITPEIWWQFKRLIA
jgi:hypothetical protein